VRLEKELERELDLPRVIRSVAGRANSSKVTICEIRRTTDRDNAVTAKTRRVEVRVVGDVKDFRAELKLTFFVERKILKDGKVQTVEAGTWNLRDSAQVGKGAGTDSARGWVGERGRIPEPRGVFLPVNGNVLDAQFQRLASEKSATSKTLNGVVRAGKANRLAAL
jgi:hypothetical protein